MTGGRADLCCMDDVETPENSYSQLLREKLSETVREVDALLKPTEDDELQYRFPHLPMWLIRQVCGRAVVLGTPQPPWAAGRRVGGQVGPPRRRAALAETLPAANM